MNAETPLVSFEDEDALLGALDRREVDRREQVPDDRRLGIEELVHDCLKQVSLLQYQVGMLTPAQAAPLRTTVAELRGVLLHAVGPPSDAVVDVRAVLRAVVAQAAIAHPCRLELYAPRTAPVRGERVMLHRALANLVLNACQAAGPGLVRVQLEVEEDHLVVEVEDSGSAHLPDRGPGLGLGLWIVHDVVDHAGGRLERGVSDLGGWCVRLRLPRSTVRR